MPEVELKHQSELGEELFDLVAFTFSADPSVFSEEGSEPLEDGGHSPLEAYLLALERRDELMRAWEEFFTDYDVLMVPAGTNTAPRHGEERGEPSPSDYPYGLGLSDDRHPRRDRRPRIALRAASIRPPLG